MVTPSATAPASPTEAPPGTPAPPTRTTAPPKGETKSLIRDLHPIETDRYPYDVGPVTVAGKTYPATLTTTCSVATWQLDRKYSTLRTGLAVTETTRSGYTFVFTVEKDGNEVSTVTREAGDPVLPLTVDVRDAFRVTLRMDSCGEPNGKAAWIDPVVTG
ncbi:NPCBM/NEW2 domain-containing protein [Streptomyces sp. NPDC058757]|uniref:NPCBM/NEW2 domain-containing protein n=1 Tax=Streptomyces sp. NPDC058757 TaxID=3346626 RepID=UPI0036B3B32C